MAFKMPPKTHTDSGEMRRVGVELEFSGVSLLNATEVISRVTGGRWRQTDDYVCEIYSRLGDFKVEFDSNFFKKKRYEKYLHALGLDPDDSVIAKGLKEAVSRLGELVIPFEVITPPLPIVNLEIVEDIREELRLHCAKGTRSAPFRAFGLQFNPEPPQMDASTLKTYLQAFFVLFDWLYEASEIPVARKVAPYIHSFPAAYMELVVDPDYNPSLRQLMTDYLEHNPTRNRPLDMLPMFSYLDHALVFSYPVEKSLVRPRPTFHYRLPNSQIDDFDWTIAREWNRWVEVEDLACSPALLRQVCEDFYFARKNCHFARTDWIQKTRNRLHV